MKIATAKYSENEILRALRSNSREITYEYTITNRSNQTLGNLEILDAQVSFDSTASVMRTFRGTCRKSDLISLENVDYRIVPWMVIQIGFDHVKIPLGKFLIEPDESYSEHQTEVNINGYDFGKIALDDKISAPIYMNSGEVYTSMALQVAGTVYDQIEFVDSPKMRNSEVEFRIGTSKLDVINGLLKAISYNPLYFDEIGVGHVTEYVFPEDRSVEWTYRADEQSIIVDGMKKASNMFEVPNKYVRYVENADAQYLISTYVNDDFSSPYSTFNRGRTIVDIASVQDIATQSDLDAYVRKVASESMRATETLEFSTLNMPWHGYLNCLFVDVPAYGIKGKYLETQWEMDLKHGGKMKHHCEKVIIV